MLFDNKICKIENYYSNLNGPCNTVTSQRKNQHHFSNTQSHLLTAAPRLVLVHEQGDPGHNKENEEVLEKRIRFPSYNIRKDKIWILSIKKD